MSDEWIGWLKTRVSNARTTLYGNVSEMRRLAGTQRLAELPAALSQRVPTLMTGGAVVGAFFIDGGEVVGARLGAAEWEEAMGIQHGRGWKLRELQRGMSRIESVVLENPSSLRRNRSNQPKRIPAEIPAETAEAAAAAATARGAPMDI